jgi:hypothetical protein
VGFEQQLADAMTTETANRVALLAGKALYSAAVCCSLLIGAVVVLPFYAYGIPPQGAGDVQAFDVKQYWPFGFEGPGALVHDIGVVLAFVGPLVIPATIIWGLLLFFGAQHRRKLALLPVLLTAFVGLAYLINWRAIIAWHLD